MSAAKDGGPAFPRPASEGHHAHDGEHIHGYGEQSGMTLRDWFAGQALSSKLRDADLFNKESMKNGSDLRITYSDTAMLCYHIADVMLNTRHLKK